MKNLLFKLLLGVGALFSLVGCNNNGGPNMDDEDNPLKEEVSMVIQELDNLWLFDTNNNRYQSGQVIEHLKPYDILKIRAIADDGYILDESLLSFTSTTFVPISVQTNFEFMQVGSLEYFNIANIDIRVPNEDALLSIYADSNTIAYDNNVKYKLNPDNINPISGNPTASVVGSKLINDQSAAAENLTIPNTITVTNTQGTTTYDVTQIDINAFYSYNLDDQPHTYYFKHVIIGNNVSTINEYAFRNCPFLESVTFGSSVGGIGKYAFAFCHKILHIVIKASTTIIDEGVFKACTSLEDVTIENNSKLAYIGSKSFENCTSLKIVDYLPKSLMFVGTLTFYSNTIDEDDCFIYYEEGLNFGWGFAANWYDDTRFELIQKTI